MLGKTRESCAHASGRGIGPAKGKPQVNLERTSSLPVLKPCVLIGEMVRPKETVLELF
jgi:hypothetical protein